MVVSCHMVAVVPCSATLDHAVEYNTGVDTTTKRIVLIWHWWCVVRSWLMFGYAMVVVFTSCVIIFQRNSTSWILPVSILASSSWLGWLASLMLDEADENGLSRLQGDAVGPGCRRSRVSSSAGIRVEEARDDLSPAVHQPPQAADRLFGLYRGGPRNGTEIFYLATEQTNKGIVRQTNIKKIIIKLENYSTNTSNL